MSLEVLLFSEGKGVDLGKREGIEKKLEEKEGKLNWDVIYE